MTTSLHPTYQPDYSDEKEEETTLTKITMDQFEDKFNKAYYKYWQAGNTELTGFSDGYVQCLEDSNAAGMLEALKAVYKAKIETGVVGPTELNMMINAINKATTI